MQSAPSASISAGERNLQKGAWKDQCNRLLNSERYQTLIQAHDGYEPGCVERAIVNAVAPEKSLGQVLNRIPEIYREIMANTRDVIEGVPALRVVRQKCTNPNCDNDDPNEFRPSRGGAVACMRCGDCQSDFMIHEGEQFRNFADQEDRSHHGPVLNPLYSASYNLGTQFTGLKGQKRNTGRETDFSVSNIGKDGAMTTRVEYKDDQKSKAFRMMREQAANLVLHEIVKKKAEEVFAAYRDARDRLYDFDAVVAACLIAGQLEVLVEEGASEHLNSKFSCPQCGMTFSTKKDAEKHCSILLASSNSNGGSSSDGGLLVGSNSGGVNGGGGAMSSSGIGRKTSSEVPVVPEIHKMSIQEVRVQLNWIAQGRYSQEVEGICKGLKAQMTAMAKEGSDDESDDGAGGEKEEEYKAGQLLIMASHKTLSKWCGGNEEAAKVFFDYLQGIKKRKIERDALLQEEEQDRKRMRPTIDDPFAS